MAAQAEVLGPWRDDDGEASAAASRLDPGSGAFREAVLVGQHAVAAFGSPDAGSNAPDLAANRATLATIAGWVDAHAPLGGQAGGRFLDAGCGPGGLLLALAPRFGVAVGLDVRLSVLRLARHLAETGRARVPFRVEGRTFEPVRIEARTALVTLVQGDVAWPPFVAESFGVVSALSLVDTVQDPLYVLGQLDALVAPGGLLVVASPYQWEPGATPPAAWWSDGGAATLRRALAGAHPALPHVRYEVVDDATDLAWTLPGTRRMSFRYHLDAVAARKLG